ncbi:hypothetical protein ACAF76_016095 [Brevibacillus sp. TJ4]|uniref:hypothetical protein n=1 Tax=Brevibacillus sp. TJ4 TaxID=3234853 RepID=UPI0037D79407
MKDVRFTLSALGLSLCFLYGFSSEDGEEKATWLWQSERMIEERQEILDFAKEQGISLMYVRFDMDRPFSAYRPFLREAAQRGIEVHAVAGDPAWALTGHRDRMLRIAKWVRQYNQQVQPEERIRGIQLDIEPYLLPAWEQERERVVREWQENIEDFLQEVRAESGLHTSAAIAFWLDEIPAASEPELSLSAWMIRRFDTVVVMAYRDQAEGANGIVELVEQELQQSAEQGKKLLVAVNLKSQDEPHTTFADEGVAEMEKQIRIVAQLLAEHPAFGGIAIHDYRYWQELREVSLPVANKQVLGTYIWRAEQIRSEKQEILDFARKEGINLLYVRIDMGLPQEVYREFNRAASAQGIELHALGGHPVWALTESREKIFRLVDWVRAYNEQAAEDERFVGIHLDVEPYVLPLWSLDKEGLLRQWMGNIQAFAQRLEEHPRLQSSVDLAAWLDNATTPGQPDLPFSHWMISQLDHTTLMAFRDYAEGEGGILSLVDSEIRYAESIGKELVVAVEIKESHEGNFVSFFEEGKSAMNMQLALVRQSLKAYGAFKGIAVHAYDYWKNAKE